MLEVKLDHVGPGFRLRVELAAAAEILVLLGASGAGKTLTLRAVAGLTRPQAGRIVLRGRVLFDSQAGVNLPPEARRVGYVPQSYALFPHLTVFQNVAYGLRGVSPAELRARVSALLRLVGLEALADRLPRQLSGGQQQRVALVRALAVQPDALLLDEPLSALDAPTRGELRGMVRDLQRRFEIPTLFVTHDLAEATFLADRIAVIEAGEVLQVGTVSELLARPAHVRVAQLAGVRNILPGEVRAVTRERVLVQVGQRTLVARAGTTAVPLAPGEAVYVCLRAERITLVLPERSARPRANVADGVIVGEYGDGRGVVLRFRLHGSRLVPDWEHDLEIELPQYVYQRLGLSSSRVWTIAIPEDALHLLPASLAACRSARASVTAIRPGEFARSEGVQW